MGWLADTTSIEHVYGLCAFLPALGMLAALLPSLNRSEVPDVRGVPCRGEPVAPIEMQ
jgi:hypothetical protein